MTDTLDLDALESIAKAATRGDWAVEEDRPGNYSVYAGRHAVVPGTENDPWPAVMHGLKLFYLHDPDWNADNNFKYLEAFGPNTILALIAKIREYEAHAKDTAEVVDRLQSSVSLFLEEFRDFAVRAAEDS